MKNAAVGVVIAALPWLISGAAKASDFPPLLAYLFFPGRDLLLLLGIMVMAWAVLREGISWDRLTRPLRALSGHRAFGLIALALVTVIAFARVPQEEKEADAFGGDEPKYLRIAFSVLRDTDADISGGRTQTPNLQMRLQQLKHVVLESRDAFVELFEPVRIPEGHVWNAGNWTVRGLDGGLYHLQPPGLPALVAVALGVGEVALPERDPGLYVFFLLSLVWILAARELWLMSMEFSGDALNSFLLVALVFLSAPVFVGGYQLFPESLCLLLFPWLLRRLGAGGRPLGKSTGLACGLLSGYLHWVHPKLTVVAAFFALLAFLRPNTSRQTKALFFLGFALTAFSALLYCHHISGLFRPEGLYIRQAEEYVGSPNPFSLRFFAGLVKALVGGRDGLLLFAPVFFLGFCTLPRTKEVSRTALEMAGLFTVVWLTSAVHDGASLGSPARLMAPVAFVPAYWLVRHLRESEDSNLRASALLLFVFGLAITATMTSDWRRNVNPYRTMFGNPAANFEASLPGNSFSDESYLVDLEKAALILITLLVTKGVLRKLDPLGSGPWAPARFGAGALAVITVLAYGLVWLSP